MAASIIAVEWRNQNSLRNYPFREDCGLRPNDSAGNLIENDWRLPNYLITDLVIGINGTAYSVNIYLKRLSTVNGTVTLTFAEQDGEDAFTVASSESHACRQIAGVGKYADARGSLFFGDIERFFAEVPDGLYSFDPSESLIEPTCIRPSAQGLNSISTADRLGYVTAGLKGDVKLIAGDNIHIRYDIASNALVFSADSNSGYTDGCLCDEDELGVIRTINGIKTEDVTIVGDDCVSVTTENGVITISDTCSKPCCGCAETAFINQTINDLSASVSTLTKNASLLSDRIQNLLDNFLLARKTLI